LILENVDLFLGRNRDQAYVVLKIKENDEILLMIKEIDKIVQSYNFSSLLTEGYNPHISLASVAISDLKDLKKTEENLKKELKTMYVNKNVPILISQICCKIGERLNYFKLK